MNINDYWFFSVSLPCLCAGSDCYQDADHGLLCVDRTSASDASACVSCRLMEI